MFTSSMPSTDQPTTDPATTEQAATEQATPARGRLRRRVSTTVAAALMLTGVAAALAPAAQAAQYGNAELMAGNSSLVLDVPGGSTAPGTGIIQWYANGGQNQRWTIPGSGYSGTVSNNNSHLCLTTDGVAGDQLTQQPCTNYNPHQNWVQQSWSNLWTTYQWLQNPASGLVVDIYGSSQWAGAPVDAWYPNGGMNQSFVQY